MSKPKKSQKYEPPLKIEGDLKDVLNASFKGVPDKLKKGKKDKNKD